MKRVYAVLLVSLSMLVCLFASCISRETAEQHMPKENESIQQGATCTVTFYDGQNVLQQLTVQSGSRLQGYPQEYDWRDDNGDLVDVGSLVVTSDMHFYAAGKVSLAKGRVCYMAEQSQQFRPDEYVTRGQAAQIVCALIVPDTSAAGSAGGFPDVPADSQYYDAVQVVSSMELMNGYSDGTFRPDEPITRSELLAVACRVTGTEEVQALAFPDVTEGHWALGSVAAAMTKGWIKGYDDGSFYPDQPVTRGEAAVLIDRALGRTPNKTAIDAVYRKSPYTDVHRWDWAYYDIVYASADNELLAYIMGEVEGLKPGFVLVGEQMCHVNEELKLDYFEMGFHKVEDGLESDGVYYVPENGYFVQRNEMGLQEFDGDMFYVPFKDGPFVCDYDLGYLHFGENGRYTSGDPEVDGYVNAIMKPIIMDDTNNLRSETKLREAYNAIVYGGYGYMRRLAWARGSTGWALEAAKVMYETKRGSCYYWAASFLFLARRLGYQEAYPVCGGVGGNNQQHAWVVIPDETGTDYIYDVELDWAYRTNYYHNGIGPADLFKQLRGHAYNVYIFPGDTYSVPPSDEDLITEETPAVIWPSTVNGSAYMEIDGQMIQLPTSWTPILDVSGNVIGYTVMAEYGGMTYSYQYMVDTFAPPAQSDAPTQTADPMQTADPFWPDDPMWPDEPGWTDDPFWPDDPMWTEPGASTGPSDPSNPGGSDPNNPSGGDPNNPSGGDPNDPSGGDPNNPSGGDPNDPSGGDPNNPGGNTGSNPGGDSGSTGGDGGSTGGDGGSTGGDGGSTGSDGGSTGGDGGSTGGEAAPSSGGETAPANLPLIPVSEQSGN